MTLQRIDLSFLQNYGLTVKIIPKPNFNQTIATLSIGIGSLNQTFDSNCPIPLGSAHFLEHQLFERKQYNIWSTFQDGGTLDSINKITKETLYNMFDSFYVTQNALLVISTPLNITAIHDYITKESNKMYLNIKEDYITHDMNYTEPKNVLKELDEIFLPLIKEQVYVGIKITHNFTKEKLYYKLILEIYVEMLLKRNSNFYVFIEDTFAIIVIIEETENSPNYSKKIIDLIYSSKIEKALLKRTINKKISVLLDYSNSAGWLQKKYVTYYFDNMNFLEVIKTLENISFSKLEKTITHLLKESTYSILSIKPNKLS